MKVLLVRHAPAEDRELFAQKGKSDALRPLTKEGVRKMTEVTRGLKAILEQINLVVSSPLTRAIQTADIIHQSFPGAELIQQNFLAPEGSYEEAKQWLAQKNASVIALVGHEPHISGLTHFLLSGKRGHLFNYKKGAAAFLELNLKLNSADLIFMCQPAILRQIGKLKK